MGRRRHVARGGAPTRPLSTESLSPGRLPPDEPRAAGPRRRRHARRHRRHGNRVRNRAGASPLRRAVGRPHRHVAANRDQHVLQLQGYATYWAAVVDGTVVDDVAWSYDDPPPECPQLRRSPRRRAGQTARIRASARLRLRGVTPITVFALTSYPTVPSP